MMEYRGYKAQIDFDDNAGLFHGEVINTRDGITFHGRTVDELRHGFREAVDDYLDWCARRGAGDLPLFSGRLSLRLPPDLHRSIAAAARRDGKTITTWITERLGEVVGRNGADAR
jgi:predicted HicB family RNase H-like nuclease